mgnify:CR=1 FL=1
MPGGTKPANHTPWVSSSDKMKSSRDAKKLKLLDFVSVSLVALMPTDNGLKPNTLQNSTLPKSKKTLKHSKVKETSLKNILNDIIIDDAI